MTGVILKTLYALADFILYMDNRLEYIDEPSVSTNEDLVGT